MAPELTWRHAEFSAKKPAKGSEALEADPEGNRGNVLIGFRQEPAGCSKPSRLKVAHRGLSKCCPEHSLEVIGRQARDLGHGRYGERLIVAGFEVIASAVEPAVKLGAGRRPTTGEGSDLLLYVVT